MSQDNSDQSSVSEDSFWKAMDILIRKPHVVNKRLWGCKFVFKSLCLPESVPWSVPTSYRPPPYSLEDVEVYKEHLFKDLLVTELQKREIHNHSIEVMLLELLPKTYSDCHAFQLIILVRENRQATFYDVTSSEKTQKLSPNFSYTLLLENGQVKLNSESNTSKAYQWLHDTVLPQFKKWAKESKSNILSESLALLCNEKYYEKYNELKFKYGKEMVKIWPECTDPSKFVYEDVAIATYLILLWNDERLYRNISTKQSFIDLGCGNGLLVFILTKEGHNGIGIDVRKRQIWDMYPKDVHLEEKTITPSDCHLFPETDWLIGNHSDELTPWIPVIAARSSYRCNFFLLPCCAYNFDGTKYQRQNSGKSQYTEYLQYIRNLSDNCGFRTDTDRLKIPSTKRICIIGRGRTYDVNEHDIYSNKIQKLISNSGNTDNNSYTQDFWIKDFKPRQAVEKVRNCTQVDKNLIESIVETIANHLLKGCTSPATWSIGKTAELSEVVELIASEKLKALKSECGGLQTVLKNNYHIFKVQGGKVELRYPKTVQEVKNNLKINKNKPTNLKLQQKLCWFYNNHPQGCPLKDTSCSFLHVKKENNNL